MLFTPRGVAQSCARRVCRVTGHREMPQILCGLSKAWGHQQNETKNKPSHREGTHARTIACGADSPASVPCCLDA